MKTCESFGATIFVGLREGYDGRMHDAKEAEDVCAEYCDAVGLCVTVTPTTFVYVRGREPGVVVGLINYPRFPSTRLALRDKALVLAARLKTALGQLRVSVRFDDETVMLTSS